MLGLEIFVHSLKMVLRNLKEAMQISVVPALIGGALMVCLFFVFDIPFENFDSRTTGFPEGVTMGSFVAFFLSLAVVFTIVIFWIVVSWHRFVLLEEYPRGMLPPFKFDRVLAYLGRVLLLGLFAIGLMVPGSFIAGSAIQASVPIGIVVWVVLVAGLWIGFYRFSPVLPGAAIGKPMTFYDAWHATAGSNGQILLLIFLSFIFQLLMQFLVGLVIAVPVMGLIISVFVTMLILPLINVSILTTMYGVFIEKRELA
ncbi:hypothetical protein [Ruegeria arenilitoris]|uniref:hypothetical protein n=1 Tax=Ruegeria arenilitoris TaxID=1173585 RepID=UPI001CFC5FEB|nr:hypothetical protein [Ruegeria arenilitoris]